ncbi:isochorismatase hydrolase [Lichtheimia corymbifera JMRC:FSU:9682]|uniref:Isochorismatase hydrolase n=1 Tax=Lichtheimia corymbifera JMRC:FSU:9682 TaxID=1263082 RepID=A0A068SFD4_9FUNG|nr:isochorismatase hydrolase [Lichtheimia corymbifera JMRC:FSU:9682]
MSTIPKIAKVAPQSSALFICDIQERFKGVIWQYPSVITVANKMIKASKILDIPVVVTEQYPKAFGPTVQELDVSDAVVNRAKTKFSMYIPEVANALKERNTKSVILVGIESHVCVLQTALDLLENNYDVHVLADGVSSQNHSEINVAIARMRSAGATVTTSESMLFQLCQDAKHEKFKAISGLVKEYMEATKVNQILQKVSSGMANL